MPKELIISSGTSVTATVTRGVVGDVERVEDVVVHLVDVIARENQNLVVASAPEWIRLR